MVRPYAPPQHNTRVASARDRSLLALVHRTGYGRTFHIFSGPHPKLELLRRLSASSPTTSAEVPTLESTVACIPMRNIGAIIAGLAAPDPAHQESDKKLEARNTEGGELQSTRWPPLPTIAQTIDQMQGGCDGCACTRPNHAICNSLPHSCASSTVISLLKSCACLCRLVIAHQQFDPYHTAMGLLPLLAPSRPFVIWCTTLQPLAECAAKLQREPYVLNLQLCDTMSRPQQVCMVPLQSNDFRNRVQRQLQCLLSHLTLLVVVDSAWPDAS